MLMRGARDNGVCGAGEDAEIAGCVESGGDVGAVGGQRDAIGVIVGDFDGSVVALPQAFGRVVDELPQVDGAVLQWNKGDQLRMRCAGQAGGSVTSPAVARVQPSQLMQHAVILRPFFTCATRRSGAASTAAPAEGTAAGFLDTGGGAAGRAGSEGGGGAAAEGGAREMSL